MVLISKVNPFAATAWAERYTDAPANSIFSGPITSTFSAVCFDKKSFHMTVQKMRQKQLMVSNFALLLVVFQLTSWQ